MLEVKSINTFYGYSHILNDISLVVKEGEIVVLLGRNGVGKTTTLKSIMGIQPPRSGQILFHGEDITGKPPHRIARKGIALVPEDRRVIPNLTVLENLKLGMLIRGKTIDRQGALDTVFAYFPVLKRRLAQRGETLSGGEQQMLTIARAMVSQPKLMMIDEPTEGLMPILIPEIANIITKLQQDGATILLVEQNYQMSLSLSENERAYIIEKGQIRMCGTPGELQACQLEVEKFLGVKI
jgi:ABC-type branched-subunit amino acid transport system ATPase component